MSEGIGKALASAIKEEAPPAGGMRGGHIFQNPRRRCIFTMLTMNPCLGAADLAGQCGVAKNSAEWHLDALVKSGYVVVHTSGKRKTYYPEGLLSHESAELFSIINHADQSRVFREIVINPGLSQQEIALKMGKSRQWVAKTLRVLEAAGLLTTVEEGVHSRCYPTRLLPDSAMDFYRNSKDFADFILRKLRSEGGAPPAIERKGLDRINVELGHQASRFSMEIGINPYLTCLGC